MSQLSVRAEAIPRVCICKRIWHVSFLRNYKFSIAIHNHLQHSNVMLSYIKKMYKGNPTCSFIKLEDEHCEQIRLLSKRHTVRIFIGIQLYDVCRPFISQTKQTSRRTWLFLLTSIHKCHSVAQRALLIQLSLQMSEVYYSFNDTRPTFFHRSGSTLNSLSLRNANFSWLCEQKRVTPGPADTLKEMKIAFPFRWL